MFCLTIHLLLSRCQSDLKIGYLDDVTLGGRLESVTDEVEQLRLGAMDMGLVLNEGKCEVIAASSNLVLPPSFSHFTLVNTQDATLLGSPLLQGAVMDKTLGNHVASLRTASTRLCSLQSHDALGILKHSACQNSSTISEVHSVPTIQLY